MASAAAPALPIIRGTASGDTFWRPRSRSTSCWSSSEPRPPMPVPITVATWSASYGRPSRQAASWTASSQAAMASWVKRSARRASLRDRNAVGSKSSQRPWPSSIPHSPAVQRSWSVVAPAPRGVTAPTPVMTTRRVMRRGRPPDRWRPRRCCMSFSVVALELDAVAVLDDLAQFDQVERVDVERLEGRVAGDLFRLGAELGQFVDDGLLDLIGGCGSGHGAASLVSGRCLGVRRTCRRRRSGSSRSRSRPRPRRGSARRRRPRRRCQRAARGCGRAARRRGHRRSARCRPGRARPR